MYCIFNCTFAKAQRNSHPRTPRSSHNLQDEQLFTLSGGIPPERFNELNYAMTQRGQRVATRAPSGDPWGYYGQQQTTAPELQEARPEPSHMPDTRPSRTESSTEAMDTDEGQRTSARLLEEAQRLSEEAHTYMTIEEQQKVGARGSDVAISDILSTQDPRELTMSALGEHRPVPTQMSAGLPEGAFSLFDFDTEFRARHGIKSEEVNQPWHSRRSSVASDLHHPLSDDGTTSRLTNISSLTPASPTRGLEVIRTPRVTREDEYAEGNQYSENVFSLDARLLQEILSGRWSQQYLYGGAHGWYRDSFYNIPRTWEERRQEGYETPISSRKSESTYGFQT